MTIPTHILVGLIIGKVTGNFSVAIAGSLVMDLDHTISYFRHGILFKPKKLLAVASNVADPWGDQRNFLHSIFSWIIISLLFSFIDLRLGAIFSVAYFCHLILDALDSADFYPFFPFFKKIVIKGFVAYYSKQEIAINACLIFVLAALFVVWS